MTNIAGKYAALGIIVLDQSTKYAARALLDIPLNITSFFSLQLIQNTGASFGIFQGNNFLLSVAGILIIGGLIYYVWKEKPGKELIFYIMIIAGALSNLIDRIVYGAVTDFIYFNFWPAFNIADAAITLGVIGLLFTYVRS
ncbi:MAG TPA: signal peptidase II [Candidatus Nanoarchaeia archaeon]|nr:signal peptidase II [Candidatus Nanoarchaeia archaeon]